MDSNHSNNEVYVPEDRNFNDKDHKEIFLFEGGKTNGKERGKEVGTSYLALTRGIAKVGPPNRQSGLK